MSYRPHCAQQRRRLEGGGDGGCEKNCVLRLRREPRRRRGPRRASHDGGEAAYPSQAVVSSRPSGAPVLAEMMGLPCSGRVEEKREFRREKQGGAQRKRVRRKSKQSNSATAAMQALPANKKRSEPVRPGGRTSYLTHSTRSGSLRFFGKAMAWAREGPPKGGRVGSAGCRRAKEAGAVLWRCLYLHVVGGDGVGQDGRLRRVVENGGRARKDAAFVVPGHGSGTREGGGSGGWVMREPRHRWVRPSLARRRSPGRWAAASRSAVARGRGAARRKWLQ